MPRKILASQRARYWSLRQQGHTIRASAAKADFSESYAKKLEREGIGAGFESNRGTANAMREIDAEHAARPKRREELDPIPADCLEDFARFRARYLGSISMPWQEEAAEVIVRELESDEDSYGVINAPQGSGKPVADTALIVMGDGSRKRLRDVREGDYVISHKGRPCRVVAVHIQGDLPTVKITSQLGRSTVAAEDHPFLTTRGCVNAADLAVGDRFPLIEPAPVVGSYRSAESFRLAGYLVGDGCTVKGRCEFTTADPDVASDFIRCADTLGWVVTPKRDPRGQATTYCATGVKGNRYDGPTRFVMEAGLRGCNSHTKRVPGWVFTAPADRVAEFIGAYLDCDGTVTADGSTIEFCSVNRLLLADVQHLLLRFGVSSSLRAKRGRYNGQVHHSFRLTIRHRERFARVVRSRGTKAERLAKVRQRRPFLFEDVIASVEPAGTRPCRCLTVEDDHTFIADDFPVHNSRLFSHDIPAWLTARDRTLRGILGSAGLGVSQAMTGNLRDTLERTSPAVARETMIRRGLALNAVTTMAADYGRFKPVASGGLWKRDAFTVEQIDGDATQDKESTWAAFSYEAKFLSWRVDFMNWDDLHTAKQLANPAAMQTLFEWWDNEAESRLDPGGLCLVTMQRLGANDISRYLLDKIDPEFEIDADRPDQGPRQYFHIKFKAHYDDRCQRDHGRDSPPWPDGCLLEPRRVHWGKIRAKKIAGIYEVVYQQEDIDPSSVLVRQEWIDGGVDPYDGGLYPGCWDSDRMVGELPAVVHPGWVRYITVDPSPTRYWSVQDWLYVPQPGAAPAEETKPGDRRGQLTGFRYLIDVFSERMQANELLDWANDQQSWTGLLDEWVLRAETQGVPVTTLIFEKNAAQRWAMQYEHFRRWQQVRGVTVVPHETTNNKSDPDLGIESLIPAVYKHGRVRLPGKGTATKTRVHALTKEVTQWPNGATDDAVMAQWFGEYHLGILVSAQTKVGPMYTDIPEWIRGRRHAGVPGSLQARVDAAVR